MISGNKVYINHLFEMASINIDPKIPSSSTKVAEMWIQQHASKFMKLSLIAKKQEVVLMH